MWRVALLLSPRLQSLRNRWRRGTRADRGLAVLFAVLGLAFWIGMVVGTVWLVGTFYSVEVFGPILTRKLLELLLLSLFAMLLFSNTVTGLSTFYLSDDLELVLSLPVSRAHFHFARLLDTLFQTSWMLGFFGVPLVIAYGSAYHPGAYFYGLVVIVGIAFALIPASTGVGVASVLVTVFPARRLREVLAILGVMMLAALFLLVRILRPERLVDPESFESLAAYVAELQAPIPRLAPPRWASDVLLAVLQGRPLPWLALGLLLTGAIAVTGVSRWLTDAVYDQGRSKAQGARSARLARSSLFDAFLRLVTRPLSDGASAIVVKDLKTFFRDPAQWTQLFILGSILAISLTSVAAFPLDTFKGPWMGTFRNMLAFLDLGLVGFVMAAVAARFQFTAVSAEGRGFWLVRTGPITAESYLWSKVWPGLVPMLGVGEILAVASTLILGAGGFLVFVAGWLAFWLAFGLSGIAIGLGAVYADFRLDNAARVAAGPAGMLFMVIATTFVFTTIGLLGPPVYLVLRADVEGLTLTSVDHALIAAGLVASALLCLAAAVLPVRRGAKILWSRELPS
jgi:ABC-2 type transport system permease protein